MKNLKHRIQGGGYIGSSPLSVLVNGDIAVQYFFVLSGFLAAYYFIRSPKIKLSEFSKLILNRYLRLLPMVLLATMMTFIFMKFNLLNHLKAANYVKNPDFLVQYCNFTPTLQNLLYNIFFKSFLIGNDYVGPFWTIPPEFWGYIITLILCKLLSHNKYRKFIYTAIAILTWPKMPNLFPFILGIFLSDLYITYTEKQEESYLLMKLFYTVLYNKNFQKVLLLIGVYLACIPMYFAGIYKWLTKIPYLTTSVYRAIGVSILIFILLNSVKLQKIMSHKLLVKLGSLSFVIYSIHWPLMLSLQDGIFVCFISKFNYHASALLSFGITVPVILFLSYIISKYYEARVRLKIK